MGLEALTGTTVYINSLVPTNPVGATDAKSAGDDHIRGVKNVILNTFPNITGIITGTQTTINHAVDGAFPSGTLCLFQQTAAPTNWTKQTTHNDKGLRVVSGTASSGGTDAFSTSFSASKATDGHALTVSEIPAHTHSYNTITTTAVSALGAGLGINTQPSASTGSTGGGGSHSHTIAIDLEYVDIIIASRD